jgi:hypothetical protein
MGTAWGKDAEEAKACSNTGGSEATNTDPIIDVVVIRANGDEIKLESSETIDVRALKEQLSTISGIPGYSQDLYAEETECEDPLDDTQKIKAIPRKPGAL